jgi:hypothetical protein
MFKINVNLWNFILIKQYKEEENYSLHIYSNYKDLPEIF